MPSNEPAPAAPRDEQEENDRLLYVGDHVVDRDDEDDTTMLVVGISFNDASEHEIDGSVTVADVNEDYPDDDDVVECVFLSRTDREIDGKQTYAYPASRLERVAAIHDVQERPAVDVLESLFATAGASGQASTAEALFDVATHAGFSEDLVDEARELADVDRQFQEGGEDG